ncbi:RagB/SusD family nutrient uptake outer membrane protein [uncultured Mucilaginibacter sp.]|uniref:RagB/SusD family nutrient uptake outer membrane protein n=1 Tax=uncultured Mucilaginibacter sp. TaxID=797541 RepID=UPI0025D0568C|nr:RagB/SusD family nutrient uptake outer membrane protein [uncultured Mucilaginibacter sp.]
MKSNLKTTILIFVFSLLATSCKRDLTLTPVYFEPTTFTTGPQLSAQLAGALDILETDQLYAQGLWGYLEGGADESFRSGTSASNIFTELYDIQNTEANVATFWRNLYNGVERCNVILSVADQPVMDETLRSQIKGQARFFRAYCYYLLVTRFGDVPLKTQLSTDMGTNYQLPRTPAKAVYQYILSEMTAAEPMVPTIAQAGTTTTITQTAVDGLLARVCLSMAGYPVNDATKYNDALTWAQKVINSGVHALNSTPLSQYSTTPAYARVFINNMQDNVNDKNITEGMWDAAFLSKSNATGTYAASGYPVTQTLGAISGIYCPDASASSINGYGAGTYRAFPKLYNLYASGDQRRDWNIAPYMYKDATTTKYYSLSVVITGTGTGASATAYTNSSGAITSIVVDNPGTGYTVAPTITFTSYATSTSTALSVTGTNVATATATVSGGKVTGITVTKGGSGYPTIYDRCIGKWRREYETNLPPIRLQNNTSCNFPIIRYADVLLMAAEADLKVNGAPSATAVGYFNQVRRRAFGYAPTVAVPGFDVTTFTMQDIMDERSRELCFEGLRRQDLIRWGVMATVMQNLNADNMTRSPANYLTASNLPSGNFLTNPTKYMLFPIPYTETTLDYALTQNPGWSN